MMATLDVGSKEELGGEIGRSGSNDYGTNKQTNSFFRFSSRSYNVTMMQCYVLFLLRLFKK